MHFSEGTLKGPDGKPLQDSATNVPAIAGAATIGDVRKLVGDTSKTIIANKRNNAGWHKLCDVPAP